MSSNFKKTYHVRLTTSIHINELELLSFQLDRSTYLATLKYIIENHNPMLERIKDLEIKLRLEKLKKS